MKRTSLLWAWGATVVAAGAGAFGCQAIAKVESRGVDPLVAGCSLPAGSGPRVRLANLAPVAGNADFCLRTSGGSWGRPVFRGGGTGDFCQAGLAYEGVTVPFGGPGATIDVKAIPAGQTCAAAPTSETDHVALPSDGSVMTLARIGGSSGANEEIVALPEDSVADPLDQRLRIVNFIAGSTGIQFGITADAVLPQDLQQVLSPQPIPYAGVAPTGSVGPITVDAHGYLVTLSSGLNIGLAPAGSTKAFIAFDVQGTVTNSVYAIGTTTDPAFPVRGLICDEFTPSTSNPLLASCLETLLPTLAVQTFNVSLYGGNAPYESERRQAIFNAVKNSSADMMCLLEAGDEATDKTPLIAAAKQGALAYAYYPKTDLSTPATDPTDWNGNTPAPLSTPPCGGSVDQTVVNDAWSCLVDNCNTAPGQTSGQLNGTTSCISTKCAIKFTKLDDPTNPPNLACFECMIYNVSTEQTYQAGETNCGTDTRRPFGFGGQNPSIILSKYPFAKKPDGTDDVEAFVLPSTGFRRSVLRAKLQLDPKTTIDFYCGQLSSPLIEQSLHYDGAYANGSHPDSAGGGWADEQVLQTNKLIAWVQQQSGSSPAIVAGDWHSYKNDPGATTTLDEITPEVPAAMEQAFKAVHAKDWTPQCNYCPPPENPYDKLPGKGYDFQTTYVFNMAPTATSEQMLYVPNYADPSTYLVFSDGTKGPISEYMSRSIRILRP